MTTIAADRPRIDQRRAWIILAMVVLFMMINFADKAVIGLAAVFIMRDLHLTNTQFGAIGSAFFLLFSLSAVIVGFVVNRVSTKLALAVMALIWAATQLPMIGIVSLQTLMICRIALGAGEGPAYPVALHAVYKWFPDGRRAIPTSLASIGSSLGVGLAAPVLTFLIVRYSWHAAFGFLGLVGFAWLALWLVLGKEGPLDAEQAGADRVGLERVPYSMLLTSRTFIGVTLAGFGAYSAVALSVVWVPSFFIKALGFTPTATGWIATLPPLTQIVLSPILGIVSQRLHQRGVPSRLSRGLFTGGSVALAGIAMIALSASGGAAAILLAMFAFSLCGATYAIGPTLIGEITPVHQRGAMLGLSNGLFSTAGLIAPWLMGHIVDIGADPAQGFRAGFLYAGLFILAASLVALLLIHPRRDGERFARRMLPRGRDIGSTLRA
jgi:MFS family permease